MGIDILDVNKDVRMAVVKTDVRFSIGGGAPRAARGTFSVSYVPQDVRKNSHEPEAYFCISITDVEMAFAAEITNEQADEFANYLFLNNPGAETALPRSLAGTGQRQTGKGNGAHKDTAKTGNYN